MIPRLSDRRIITYGFSPQADVRADRIVPDKLGSTFDVTVTDRARNRSRKLGPYRLPMLGSHNVQNALAAVAVGIEMEIDDDTLRGAFAGFRGVKRRFTKTGESGGITVIDDYGHHPVEIAAVLKAARQAGARNVIAVVQPHRFSRLHSLFGEFCTCMNDAGTVIVADVYPAGEAPIEGVNRDALVDGLRARGHRSVVPLPSPVRLAEMIYAIAKPGDFVVCLGAGNITQWAAALPGELSELQNRRIAGAPHEHHPSRIPLPAREVVEGARGAATATRPCASECAAGTIHLVPCRWAGRGAGASGRRKDLATVPARAAARHSGARDRRLLEPDHPRRWAARRRDPPGARLRRDHRRSRWRDCRRRGARCDRGGTRRCRRPDRIGIPLGHPWQHRRRRGDERRRLWR